MVRVGLDLAHKDGIRLPGTGRCGLLCNANTVTSEWEPTADAVRRLPGLRLARIFAPQHGFAAEKQDNMVESPNSVHPRLKIPVVSLYKDRREPGTDELDDLDAILIDLQDVGTRVYTFLVTALFTIRAASKRGLPVVILDRPNPIGGRIEGPILEDRYRSFVGAVDLPLRHGLTPAEFCIYGSWRLGLIDERDAVRAAESAKKNEDDGWLRVVRMDGWRRNDHFDATGLPWTMPSPNMPTLETAVVYPGQVLLEGTNLSEGRGTTHPFEIFGAPYLDTAAILRLLREREGDRSPMTGVVLREVAYEPTFHKFAGELVHGFQIHVTNRNAYRPIALSAAILAAIRRTSGSSFGWRPPPYEYESDREPIDLIWGSDALRRVIDAGGTMIELEQGWVDDLAAYRDRIRPLLLYGD